MTNEEHGVPSATPRGLLAVGIAGLLVMVALLGSILLTREDDGGGAAPTVTQSSAGASPTSTTLDARADVEGRLRAILRIRDKAFRERDAKILEDIYTVDCPCLEGDRNAIQELTDNDYHIEGGSTSIRIRQVNQVNERLWLIIADFRSAPLRIEAESNKLIREEQGGSDLFEFALSKPSGSDEWLLGRAAAYRDDSG